MFIVDHPACGAVGVPLKHTRRVWLTGHIEELDENADPYMNNLISDEDEETDDGDNTCYYLYGYCGQRLSSDEIKLNAREAE